MSPADGAWTPLTGGARAAWQRGGSGPLLVAVHGIEDGWHSWTPLARVLARRFRVVALDPPWRAGNDYRWRERHSPGQWLAAAVADLGEPVDVLLAHSFGANAALEALGTGLRPGRAVLVAPSYHPDDHHDPRDDAARAGLRARSALALTRTVRDSLRVRLGARQARVDPEVLAGMADGLLTRLMPLAFPVFYECFTRSGQLGLSAVDIPVLVVGGSADPALADGRAAALARDMPAADVRLHEHYGHFCHLEQAAALAAEIIQFLAARPVSETDRVRLVEGVS